MDKFIRQSNDKKIAVNKIVTVLYMEYGKDFVFTGESHDFWEFTYIDKGSVIFTADTREFLLKGGEIAFHKPNEFHKLRAFETPPNVTIVSFECRSDAMRFFENKIFKLSPSERNMLSSLIDEGRKTFEPLTPDPPIMGMREKENAPFGSKQLTFNLLEQFLVMLLRRGDAPIVRERRYVSRMEKTDYPDEIVNILQYLERHIDQPLTVAQIADAFHMSENTLKKHFSYYVPGGVTHTFTDMKIERAKYLIREQSLNFTQIAEALGFASIHYFSRLFTKKTGMTPTQFRHSIAKP